MASFSTFLANASLNLVLRGVAYTGDTTIYAALFTSPTTSSGAGNEVSGNGYNRVVVSSFEPANAGQTSNAVTVTFPQATSSWGTVTHFALFDAPTGGNMLFHGELTASRLVNAGDTFVFTPGNMNVTVELTADE